MAVNRFNNNMFQFEDFDMTGIMNPELVDVMNMRKEANAAKGSATDQYEADVADFKNIQATEAEQGIASLPTFSSDRQNALINPVRPDMISNIPSIINNPYTEVLPSLDSPGTYSKLDTFYNFENDDTFYNFENDLGPFYMDRTSNTNGMIQAAKDARYQEYLDLIGQVSTLDWDFNNDPEGNKATVDRLKTLYDEFGVITPSLDKESFGIFGNMPNQYFGILGLNPDGTPKETSPEETVVDTSTNDNPYPFIDPETGGDLVLIVGDPTNPGPGVVVRDPETGELPPGFTSGGVQGPAGTTPPEVYIPPPPPPPPQKNIYTGQNVVNPYTPYESPMSDPSAGYTPPMDPSVFGSTPGFEDDPIPKPPGMKFGGRVPMGNNNMLNSGLSRLPLNQQNDTLTQVFQSGFRPRR